MCSFCTCSSSSHPIEAIAVVNVSVSTCDCASVCLYVVHALSRLRPPSFKSLEITVVEGGACVSLSYLDQTRGCGGTGIVREALLEIAAWGPLAGTGASLAAVLAGLALSAAGLGGIDFQVAAFRDSFLVGLLGEASLPPSPAAPTLLCTRVCTLTSLPSSCAGVYAHGCLNFAQVMFTTRNYMLNASRVTSSHELTRLIHTPPR